MFLKRKKVIEESWEEFEFSYITRMSDVMKLCMYHRDICFSNEFEKSLVLKMNFKEDEQILSKLQIQDVIPILKKIRLKKTAYQYFIILEDDFYTLIDKKYIDDVYGEIERKDISTCSINNVDYYKIQYKKLSFSYHPDKTMIKFSDTKLTAIQFIYAIDNLPNKEYKEEFISTHLKDVVQVYSDIKSEAIYPVSFYDEITQDRWVFISYNISEVPIMNLTIFIFGKKDTKIIQSTRNTITFDDTMIIE